MVKVKIYLNLYQKINVVVLDRSNMPKNKKALRAKSRRNIIRGLISNPSVGINISKVSPETRQMAQAIRGSVAAKNAMLAEADSTIASQSPKKRKVNKNSYR